MEELKEAGINKHFAKTVGISVDHRRTNKSTQSLLLNVNRLKEYKARLVIFPKKADVSKDVIGTAAANKDLFTKPKASEGAITFTTVTDELTGFRAYDALRRAQADTKLVGIRSKKAKEGKDAAPAKDED